MEVIKFLNNKKDIEILALYLKSVDEDFVVPLSSKINLDQYAISILNNGQVYAIKEKEEFLGIICFYCNDNVHYKAYLPILSVKAKARGRGLSKLLIEVMIDVCSVCGMKSIEVNSINPVAISLYHSFGFYMVKRTLEDGFVKEHLIKEIE